VLKQGASNCMYSKQLHVGKLNAGSTFVLQLLERVQLFTDIPPDASDRRFSWGTRLCCPCNPAQQGVQSDHLF